MKYPDEPTTPEQWHIIAWCTIVVLLGIGAVGIYFSIGAPPDKLELARDLRRLGFPSCGLAVAVYAIKHLISAVFQ